MKRLGRIFVTGLLTVLPLLATLYFVVWALAAAERFFGQILRLALPDVWYRAGMGLAVAVLVVFGVGVMMHGLLFRRVFGWTERLFLEIPLIRSVYSALRDLLGFFAQHEEASLQVVSVEIPGAGMRVLGFVTRTEFRDLPAGVGRQGEVAVYLPMSYQIGGYTVFLPRDRVSPVQMSREDAMKFVLTAGLKSSAQEPGRRPM